jgi:hypothetical protein
LRFDHEKKTAILDLLALKWQKEKKKDREQFFSWRYESNPYTDAPIIYLAYDQDILIGLRAFVLQKFVLKDYEYLVFSPSDAIIHPSYRRMGLFSLLNVEFLNDINTNFSANKIILNLSSNKFSNSANLKLGWQQSKAKKKYSYKISFVNILKSIIYKKRDIFYNGLISKTNGEIKYEITNLLYASEISSFLFDSRIEGKITNIRDEAFFRWRYAEPFTDFKFVYCWKGSKLKGYMILKNHSSFQSIIEEYFCLDIQIMKEIIEFAVKNLSIPILRTISIGILQNRLLFRCGLIQEPDFVLRLLNRERLPVLVRPICKNPEEKDFFVEKLDLRDMDNWLIYQSDIH